MKRVKFTIQGKHPLLYLVRDNLILSGYHLVAEGDGEDFCLFGGRESPGPIHVPVLFLSSSKVYACVDPNSREPFSEASPLVVPSTLDPGAWEQALYIKNECALLSRAKHYMILRPFNVYGPDLPYGVVPTFMEQAKTNSELTLYNSGHMVRGFLHQDDFIECIKLVIKRLLKLGTGIFNVGSSEEISVEHLAESIQHFLTTEPKVVNVHSRKHINSWKMADTTRIRAFVRWQPTVTVRKGIWRLIQDVQYPTLDVDSTSSTL